MAGMLKFCGACGAPLTTASNLTWQPPTTNKPGGELRFVTIVFPTWPDLLPLPKSGRPMKLRASWAICWKD
jgi:hypothetical protein